MKDLRGKVAVVTGAASGIGLALARKFGAEGMRVVLADVEKDALQSAAQGLEADGVEALAVPTDVSQAEQVEALAQATLKAFDGIHVVCNNAGVSSGGLVEECTPGDWDWVIGVNYLGVVHGCQAFLPHLKRQADGGHVVNTASMAGVGISSFCDFCDFSPSVMVWASRSPASAVVSRRRQRRRGLARAARTAWTP